VCDICDPLFISDMSCEAFRINFKLDPEEEEETGQERCNYFFLACTPAGPGPQAMLECQVCENSWSGAEH
jgi:hypothetical protein